MFPDFVGPGKSIHKTHAQLKKCHISWTLCAIVITFGGHVLI